MGVCSSRDASQEPAQQAPHNTIQVRKKGPDGSALPLSASPSPSHGQRRAGGASTATTLAHDNDRTRPRMSPAHRDSHGSSDGGGGSAGGRAAGGESDSAGTGKRLAMHGSASPLPPPSPILEDRPLSRVHASQAATVAGSATSTACSSQLATPVLDAHPHPAASSATRLPVLDETFTPATFAAHEGNHAHTFPGRSPAAVRSFASHAGVDASRILQPHPTLPSFSSSSTDLTGLHSLPSRLGGGGGGTHRLRMSQSRSQSPGPMASGREGLIPLLACPPTSISPCISPRSRSVVGSHRPPSGVPPHHGPSFASALDAASSPSSSDPTAPLHPSSRPRELMRYDSSSVVSSSGVHFYNSNYAESPSAAGYGGGNGNTGSMSARRVGSMVHTMPPGSLSARCSMTQGENRNAGGLIRMYSSKDSQSQPPQQQQQQQGSISAHNSFRQTSLRRPSADLGSQRSSFLIGESSKFQSSPVRRTLRAADSSSSMRERDGRSPSISPHPPAMCMPPRFHQAGSPSPQALPIHGSGESQDSSSPGPAGPGVAKGRKIWSDSRSASATERSMADTPLPYSPIIPSEPTSCTHLVPALSLPIDLASFPDAAHEGLPSHSCSEQPTCSSTPQAPLCDAQSGLGSYPALGFATHTTNTSMSMDGLEDGMQMMHALSSQGSGCSSSAAACSCTHGATQSAETLHRLPKGLSHSRTEPAALNSLLAPPVAHHHRADSAGCCSSSSHHTRSCTPVATVCTSHVETGFTDDGYVHINQYIVEMSSRKRDAMKRKAEAARVRAERRAARALRAQGIQSPTEDAVAAAAAASPVSDSGVPAAAAAADDDLYEGADSPVHPLPHGHSQPHPRAHALAPSHRPPPHSKSEPARLADLDSEEEEDEDEEDADLTAADEDDEEDASILGRGSYGVVKKVFNTQDATFYAMKIMSRQRLALTRGGGGVGFGRQAQGLVGEDGLEFVRREVAIMKKLCHQNIVRLVEVISDIESDSIMLVMEYAEGGPIMRVDMDEGEKEIAPGVFNILAEPVPLPLARKYFRDILSGLEYLHHQKVIHRDLKPENLLLGADGRVMIADFGVSTLCEGDQMLIASTAGTGVFMSPEMVQAGSRALGFGGPATDVWSLGVTLFFLIYGQLPWYSRSLHDIYRMIVQDPLEFPSGPQHAHVPAGVQQLLRAMLNKDPVTRVTIAQMQVCPWVTEEGAWCAQQDTYADASYKQQPPVRDTLLPTDLDEALSVGRPRPLDTLLPLAEAGADASASSSSTLVRKLRARLASWKRELTRKSDEQKALRAQKHKRSSATDAAKGRVTGAEAAAALDAAAALVARRPACTPGGACICPHGL